MVSTVFEHTSDEVRDLIARGCSNEGIEERGVLSYLEIQADEKAARRLQARLMRLIESLMDSGAGGKKRGGKSYRLTIAYYPLDVERRAPGEPT